MPFPHEPAPRDPAQRASAACDSLAGGTPLGQNERDETLLRAIEQGLSDDQLAAEPDLTEAVAAHRKIESLFELLRQPAGLSGGMPNDQPKPDQPMPEQIGRYIVRRVLGQGTFGTVYLADDPELNRQVAVKVPRTGRFVTAADADKFLAEARHAAGLKHPGIVAVHDVGRDDLCCYIVHEFIDGRTLEDLMATERLSFVAAARLLAHVAGALHYAHQQGFVHRDLKPANIMVEVGGEASSQHHSPLTPHHSPKLLDFGLAVSEETQVQLAGHVAGTPAYMAPEQVRGETHRLDGRADIWALGVIAYQLLTGRQPFWRGDVKACLDEIEHREPKPPRQIDDSIPAELERITLRCLAKSVTDRYPTAADVAVDLRRWLATQVPWPRRRIVALVAVLVAGVAGAGVWIGIHAAPTPDVPLKGTIDVRIWNPEQAERRGLSLSDQGALPLRSGDQIRVDAMVDRPNYIYIVWISADGTAQPVYPWVAGDWIKRPSKEQGVTTLSLPERHDAGWPMSGPSGMETLVLLARDRPLPRDFDLAQLFSGLATQPRRDPRTLVWLDDGHLAASADRAPQFFDPRPIDDPLLAAQHLLAERLRPHFALVRAVSFANLADGGN